MPGSYDYVGNAMQQTNYTGVDPYTGQLRTQAIPGRTAAATSTGPYDQSSPLGSAYQAPNFNLSESGNLSQLSDLINSINRNAQTQSNQARIPNDPALEASSSEVIGSELKGQLPTDVTNLLGEAAAERGVATGTVGSANDNAAYLRALGLTSLGQIQTGEQNLTAALGRNPGAKTFDPSTQLITPLDLARIQAGSNIFQNPTGGGGGGGRGPGSYSSPYLSYGPLGTTTGTNPLTGGDVIPPDTGTTPALGTDPNSALTYGLPTGGNAPFASNYYDSNPPSALPDDYGNTNYASTPVSAYG